MASVETVTGTGTNGSSGAGRSNYAGYFTIANTGAGTNTGLYLSSSGGSTNVALEIAAGNLVLDSGASNIIVNGNTGVSCSAGTVTLLTEVVTNGIVTHC